MTSKFYAKIQIKSEKKTALEELFEIRHKDASFFLSSQTAFIENLLLFHTRLTHVGKTQVNIFSFFQHKKISLNYIVLTP